MNAILQISDPHFGTEVPAVTRALLELTHALTPALLWVTRRAYVAFV